MNQDRGDFGGGFNPWNNPMAAMAEQWMSAMQMWSQMMSSYTASGWQQPWMNPSAYGQGAPAAAVTVKLSSAQPAEVSVSLTPGADPAGLTCDPLHLEGAGGTPIDGVSIAQAGGAVQLGVKIPAKQGAGKYHGLIRRKTDRGIAGEVIVTIFANRT